jgi:hypothetical protein
VAGFCEHGGELWGFGATELVVALFYSPLVNVFAQLFANEFIHVARDLFRVVPDLLL